MNKETEQKINQLSMFEQNSQHLTNQRQNFQTQQIEIESALEEIGTTEETYKIVGNIMVKVKKEDLNEELESKKQLLTVRINTIEKQENTLREKAKKLQEEIMKELESQKE